MKKGHIVVLLIPCLSVVFAPAKAHSEAVTFDFYQGYNAYAGIGDAGGNILAVQDPPEGVVPQTAAAASDGCRANVYWHDDMSFFTDSSAAYVAERNVSTEAYQELDFTPARPALHVRFDYEIQAAALVPEPGVWDWAYAQSVLYLAVNGALFRSWNLESGWVGMGGGSGPVSKSLAGSFDEYFSLAGIPIGSVTLGAQTWASSQNATAYSKIDLTNVKIEYSPVPIPGTLWLLGSALIGAAGLRKRLAPKKSR